MNLQSADEETGEVMQSADAKLNEIEERIFSRLGPLLDKMKNDLQEALQEHVYERTSHFSRGLYDLLREEFAKQRLFTCCDDGQKSSNVIISHSDILDNDFSDIIGSRMREVLRDSEMRNYSAIFDLYADSSAMIKNLVISIENKLQENDQSNLRMITLIIQSIHKIKEGRLRERVKAGKKIKVFFLNNYISKFGMDSIYFSMEKHELFEPYVLVLHSKDLDFAKFPIFYEEVEEAYRYFCEKGFRTIFGYDPQTKMVIDIDKLDPDILFINNPRMGNLSTVKNLNLSFDYLTCYLPYGVSVVDNPAYQYNYASFAHAWKYFAATPFVFHEARKARYKGLNVKLTGYPRLDEYAWGPSIGKIPQKINNEKPLVVFAPHWSIRGSNNLATFHLYHEYFLDLVKRYTNIYFAIKPHPDLRHHLYYHSGKYPDVLTGEQYDEYLKEWDSLPNGVYVNSGDYINLFRRSSCLITDSGSFIAEYLPSKMPCIYLVNPEKPSFWTGFNEYGTRILQSYYLCESQQEIEETFNQVVIHGNDPKKDERLAVLEKSFINIGTAGQKIVEYLESLARS